MDMGTALLILGAAYLLLARPAPATRPSGSALSVSLGQYGSYTSIPGVGTRISIDPSIFQLFRAGAAAPTGVLQVPATPSDTSPLLTPGAVAGGGGDYSICSLDPYNEACYA